MAKMVLHVEGAGLHRAPVLRDLLDVLVVGCQQATRLRVDGRSTAPGTVPGWLESVASFDVSFADATSLELESMPFARAITRGLPRGDLLAGLDPAKSCLDLLEDSLEDALAGKADSDSYDPSLMDTLAGLGRLFRYGVETIEMINGRTLRVDRQGVDGIRALRTRTPEDRRVMIAGKLEMIRHSDRSFTLLLPSGEVVRGIATEQVNLADLAGLFGKPALVSGIAKFRPSRAVLRVEAEHVRPPTGDVSVFARLPKPLSLDMRALRVPQGPTSGASAIFGQLPGDETDEEFLRAVEALS